MNGMKESGIVRFWFLLHSDAWPVYTGCANGACDVDVYNAVWVPGKPGITTLTHLFNDKPFSHITTPLRALQ